MKVELKNLTFVYVYVFVLTLACPIASQAQFVEGGSKQSTEQSSSGSASGAPIDIIAEFDNHELEIRAREIQYHKKIKEFRALLELHDKSRFGRRMSVWIRDSRSLALYDAYLNEQKFVETNGVNSCDRPAWNCLNSNSDSSVLSHNNPTYLVAVFSASNLESEEPMALAIPVLYSMINKDNGFDATIHVADTITFRDLPIRVIE